MIKVATTATIQEYLRQPLVLIDFWAPWCAPCMNLAPVIESVSSIETDVVFIKVNIDECNDLAQKFNVTSIPLLVLYKNGQEVARTLGFKSATALQKFINDNR